MKTGQTLFLLLLPCFFVSGAVAHAEQADATALINYATGNPQDWPENLDAVIAAPDHHTVLLENDSVRVLDVTVLPGVVEPLHSHRWPSVLYIQAAGHFIDRDSEGNVIFDTREMDAPLQLPATMWKEPEAPHSVENLSDTETIRLIRVELKNR